jgi:hypothetical protein
MVRTGKFASSAATKLLTLQRGRLELRRVTPQPPAWVLAAMRKDRADTRLVNRALLIGVDTMVLEWGEQELRDLHAAISGPVMCADAPHCPVAAPQEQRDGEKPEKSIRDPFFGSAYELWTGNRHTESPSELL